MTRRKNEPCACDLEMETHHKQVSAQKQQSQSHIIQIRRGKEVYPLRVFRRTLCPFQESHTEDDRNHRVDEEYEEKRKYEESRGREGELERWGTRAVEE
jgi:hypothetical protein